MTLSTAMYHSGRDRGRASPSTSPGRSRRSRTQKRILK
jgi:hypothetical protein